MKNGNGILKSVWAALEREPLINLNRWPLRLSLTADRALVLEGETESVAAKKTALDLAAAAIPDVRGVVDRLRVVPSEPRGDGAILDSLAASLLSVRELKNCTLRMMKKEQSQTLQDVHESDASGDIMVSVKDGVVALDGWVISLSHKRLAGVLAWWVPGCRDVLDSLEVMPPELDNDDEVSDALSLVLEMDPTIPHPDQIRIQTRDRVVTLEGVVGSQTEKSRAEQDAWCLYAVERVVNRLAVNG
jgi:osmotically-inducible protein OsmY